MPVRQQQQVLDQVWTNSFHAGITSQVYPLWLEDDRIERYLHGLKPNTAARAHDGPLMNINRRRLVTEHSCLTIISTVRRQSVRQQEPDSSNRQATDMIMEIDHAQVSKNTVAMGQKPRKDGFQCGKPP